MIPRHNAKVAWLNRGFKGNNSFWGMIMSILYRLRSRSAAVTPGLRNVTASGSEHGNTSPIANRLRILLCDNQGAAILESAIASFLMIPLLLGTFSVCMALVAYQQLGYTTMTATQTLAEGRGILTDPCATAASKITSMLPQWNAANITYTVTITSTVNAVSTTTPYGPYTGTAAATCTAAATTLTNAIGDTNGNPVTLHTSYAYPWFPYWGKKITGTLATEFTMLVE
jgi:Flp pilus assembly protein TadG